jgi:hypothetical protein
MKKRIVCACAALLFAATVASAQITVGASYMPEFYSSGISHQIALDLDFNVRSFRDSVDLLFWQDYFALVDSLDFVFLRSPANSGPFGYSFGVGPQIWISFFLSDSYSPLDLYLQLHLPLEAYWQPSAKVPFQVFLKLSPYTGVLVYPFIGNIFFGLDAFIGVRYVVAPAGPAKGQEAPRGGDTSR